MERAVSVQREVGLSGTALKVIALVTMLLDHIHYFFGYTGLVPEWFSMAGRISGPLFFILRGGGIYPYQKQKEIFSQNLWHCGGNGPDFISDEGVWSFCESRWFLSCERGDGRVCNFNGYVAGNGLDWEEKTSERNLCAAFAVFVVFRRGRNLLPAFYAGGSGGGFFESYGSADA